MYVARNNTPRCTAHQTINIYVGLNVFRNGSVSQPMYIACGSYRAGTSTTVPYTRFAILGICDEDYLRIKVIIYTDSRSLKQVTMDNGEEKKCGDHPVQFSTGPSSRPEWSNTQGQVAPPSGGGIRYTTDEQARARSAAGCAYCLLAFGIFMFIPGGILTGEGYKRRDSDFFATRDAAFRVIGPLLLCLASVLLLVGLSFAWVIGLMCLKEKRTARTMPPQTVGPIVSGTYPGQGNVIQYSGAPPPGPAYPTQGHGGTTGVEYTVAQPGGATVPPQVAPQDTCRPIGPSAPPENNDTADLPPPPSYDVVV